jgi:citrate lyase subunit beta/citryl-CoA lyase
VPERWAPRSHLYVPGDRPELFAKAERSGADAVVLDLEDAVAPERRDAALANVVTHAPALVAGGRIQLQVRVPRAESGGYDLAMVRALVEAGVPTVRLPKCDAAEEIAEIRSTGPEVALIPIIESARGLVAASALAAAPGVIHLALGATDLLADLDISDDSDEVLDEFRLALVVASRAAGIGAPIDGVFTRLDDGAGLVNAASRACRLGMSGKSVIHPAQVETVNAAWRPSADDVAQARRLVEAFERSATQAQASIRVEGQFVDPAVVARAHRILDRIRPQNSEK